MVSTFLRQINRFVFVLVLVPIVEASNLYSDDLFYLSDQERISNAERVAAIDMPSEAEYLTQIALEKPKIFIRQVRLVQEVVENKSDVELISDKLREAGFYSIDIQDQLIEIFNLGIFSNPVTEAEITGLTMVINESSRPWKSIMFAERLEDYAAIECASDKIPSHLTGPLEHQYMIRIAYPDMNLSLWRFNVIEAVSFPVALVDKTTVDTYELIDRFGQRFGQIDRSALIINGLDSVLKCSKFSPFILRAFKDHQRELLLAEKQL